MNSTTSNGDPVGERQGGGLSTLVRYLRPQAGKASLMALLLLSGIGLQLLIPQILRGFIDSASAGAPLGELRNVALLFLAVALGQQMLAAAATYLGADVGWTATNSLRSDLASKVLTLDMSFHGSRTPGEMIERIDGDVTSLSNFFSQFSVRVFGGLLLLAGILVVLWFESPWVGLALTGFTVMELLVLSRTRRVGVPATTLEREVNARLFGFIEERLGGIDDIRANGAGAHAMHRFAGVMREFFTGTRRAWMMRSVVWLSSYGLFVAALSGTLVAVVILVSGGRMTLGTGYMVFQYLLMLQTPIDQITQQMQELQKAVASIGRVRELLSESPSPPPAHPVPAPAGPLEVRFEGVDFRYEEDSRSAQLEGVDFTLPAGKVLGLLGRTGSGKTTITRLLFGLYRPGGGRILLSGVDAANIEPAALRSRIGLVTQDVQLFGASVRDNLTFFRGGADDERLESLLRELGLGHWLDSLGDGLDSRIDSAGGNLSAGEAQLLAFARVFLKDPGLVVLDEPSSRLDPASEHRLGRVVDRLLSNRTAILVAHRLQTVERAHYILVMDEGRALEFGPREELAADPSSRYARMLAASRAAEWVGSPGGGKTGNAELDGELFLPPTPEENDFLGSDRDSRTEGRTERTNG